MAFDGTLTQNFLVAVREAFEAFLVVGILLGMASKLGHAEGRRPLWLGALLGFLVSALAGVLVVAGMREAVAEGGEAVDAIGSLVAFALLTYMVVWMQRHTQDLIGALHGRTREALAGGKAATLVGMAFVAVVREGVETAVFVATSPASTASLLLAVAGGIAVAAGLAWLAFAGVVRLSMRTFFLATGSLLVLFAAYILWKGLAEAVEEGMRLGEAGGLIVPAVAILYATGMLAWLLRPLWRRPKAPA